MLRIEAHIDLVEAFRPADPVEERTRALILDLLTGQPRPFDRATFHPGHITASGIVLSPECEHILVVHHRRLDRWLQPGGHLESTDAGAWAAARREIREETAVELEDLDSPLIGMDVHEIPAARGEPVHLHHDLCFLFKARSRDTTISTESDAIDWWTRSRLSTDKTDMALTRYARRAMASRIATFPTA